MFERFSDRARRTVVAAQEEARRLRFTFIGPEHLLLALLGSEGLATQALESLGVSLDEARGKVEQSIGAGTAASGPTGHIPFKPGAKKVLELSLREALGLGHNYIGTEHLLLGLIRQGADDPHAAVRLLGVEEAQVRTRIQELLSSVPVRATTGRSPALDDANRRARELAAGGTVTTGHLLAAMLGDESSHAARVLSALGVTGDQVAGKLAEIPVAGTSDAPPAPRSVEIKLGEQTLTIDDPAVAAGLSSLSPEQVRAVLQAALGTRPEQPPAASA
jgi:ATP-dependent Clp protease ATP-binding subunit ClpA